MIKLWDGRKLPTQEECDTLECDCIEYCRRGAAKEREET